MIIHQKKW